MLLALNATGSTPEIVKYPVESAVTQSLSKTVQLVISQFGLSEFEK